MAAIEQPLVKCIGCRKKFNSQGYSINRHGAQLKTCIECQQRKQAKAAAKRAAKQPAAEQAAEQPKARELVQVYPDLIIKPIKPVRNLKDYEDLLDRLRKEDDEWERRRVRAEKAGKTKEWEAEEKAINEATKQKEIADEWERQRNIGF